jgi:hypothetical protein
MSRSRATAIRVVPAYDAATAAAGMARPGMDPRQWISYGVVHATDPKDVVTFDEEYGQPLVSVRLMPSMRDVHCRVSSTIAGNGEGEYHPFIKGDEVLVAIPEGVETAGCCIIGRLNNAHDKFPMDSVGGQDPTTNVFGFRRRRTPFIEELAGPIMFRSVPSGAFLSIDATGVVSLRDGEKNALQMSPDVFGYVSGDGTAVLQMSLTGQQFIMQMGSAYMQLSHRSSDPNTILVPGSFVLGTSGNTPAEHVLTVEGFLCFFKNFLNLNGTLLGFIPGVTLDPLLAAITTATFAPGTGSLVDVPTTTAALLAGFNMPIPKPPAVGGLQIMPGFGCKGFLVG